MVSGWGVSRQALSGLATEQDQVIEWHAAAPPSEPCWVFGWSLGGVVASQWLAHPNVKGLVTLGTPDEFSSQVNPVMFRRLRQRVERDSPSALAGFYQWLLPDASPDWHDTHGLLPGLDCLETSHCQAQWSSSDRPQLHLRGLSDPLYHSATKGQIEGDHQVPFLEPDRLRQRMDAFVHEF